MKLCFISYARNSNLDGRLGKFVEKLEKQVPGHLPNGTKVKDVAFFDAADIENGNDWMARLSDATRACKVCVCFYSPPYFTSEYSGREVQVFLQRIRAWQTKNAGRKAGALVPVIWVPHDDVPAILQPFQYSNSRQFPDNYHQEGLHALAMRKGRSDSYNRVLNALAIQIAQAIKSVDLPVGDPIGSFDALPSAFHAATDPVRYGVAVTFLVTGLRRVQPFAIGGGSLDTALDFVAHRTRVSVREIAISKDTPAEIQKSAEVGEMSLLIADRESFESSNNRAVIGKIAAKLGPLAAVIVVADPDPNAVEVVASLRQTMSTRLAAWKDGAAGQSVVTDTATLQAELERRVSKGVRELVARAPAARATDALLEKAAESRGIAVDAQPILVGPGA